MTSTVQELPRSTWDGQAVKAAFDAARASQPWTLGYRHQLRRERRRGKPAEFPALVGPRADGAQW